MKHSNKRREGRKGRRWTVGTGWEAEDSSWIVREGGEGWGGKED